jgi:thiol-disulfide isomerase/thioredoxin
MGWFYICATYRTTMKTMSFFGFLLFSAFTLSSCADTASAEKPKTTSATAQQIPFTNGVTSENKGSKQGPIELKGTHQNPQLKKIYLWNTYGRTNTLIDSASVSNGSFSFGTKTYNSGLYMIGINENNMASIILHPNEPVVEVSFKAGKMDSGAQAVQSKENEGYWSYMPREAALLKAIKDARIAASKSSIKAEFEKQIVAKEIELATLQGEMIAKYPNTFLAKLLTWKQEPFRSEKAKYWDNIDFSDESIIRTLALSDRIQNFMRSFSGGTESGFIDCIAQVAEKGKANPTVLEFALNQMMVGFYESGMENISTYIIDNYINGESCGDVDLTNIIKSNAESLTRLSIGNTPPNISGSTSDGKTVDLMKLAATKKYTLVMFWSSWCEHCQGEAPEVVACYEKWKSKGFEIVGYSVDTNKAAWEKAVTDRGFLFPNLCGFKQWDSKAAKDYRITKTPGFFLLDNTGKIVLKPKGIREVQAFLTKQLAQ